MNARYFHTVLLSGLLAPALLHADSATIKAPLHAAADADAAGIVRATLRGSKSELIVFATNLTASHLFQIEVGGIVEGTLTTDGRGRANARFRTSARGNTQVLDFDARGKTVRILDDQASVLEGVVSGRGEDSGVVVDERVDLSPDDHSTGSTAHLHYTVSSHGRRHWEIEVPNIAEGSLRVFVDGVEKGELVHHGKRAAAVFDSTPRAGGIALDFDPRGSAVDIMSDDRILFSGKFEAKARGVNFASPSRTGVLLPSTGTDADGTAFAELRIDDRAQKRFSVELEDVPAGAYDFLVDDTIAGTIQVTSVDSRTQGELEFANDNDDLDKLPLNFDPAGKTLTVRQGAVTFFEGPFNVNVNGAGAPNSEAPSELNEDLISTGLDPDGAGHARYRVDDRGRHKFSVEIENVPEGTYTVTVAGVARGTFQAVAIAGKVQGEIEFSSGERAEARHAARRGVDDGNGSGRQGGSSGGGGGMDDPAGDDHGGLGGGTDDPAGDDHGGVGGGTDDPAGDDHGGLGGGTDDPAGDDHGATTSGVHARELPLRFDPRGQTVEIISPAGTFFSHLLGNGSVGTPGTVTPFRTEVPLINSGATPAATAKAELKQNENGERSFEVEVEDLPVGTYELLVAGTVRAEFDVVAIDQGTRAKVQFDTEAKPDKLVLDFEVAAQDIAIRQGATILFSRLFPQ